MNKNYILFFSFIFLSLLFWIGFIKDYTKRYDLAFALGGGMIVIAAFFHIAIAAIKPECRVSEEEEETEGENFKAVDV